MKTPWLEVEPVGPPAFARIRMRTIFEHCKWDPQVGDVAILSPQPLALSAESWQEVSRLAGQLAAEALAAEEELRRRPELHAELGLPGAVRRVLRRAAEDGWTPGLARLMRFDFHFTADGWRISEVNSDVPGGLNEASGFTRLVAEHYRGAAPAGDPSAALADAIREAVGPCGSIAFIHATAFTDDRQVMVFIAQRMEERGMTCCFLAPDHLAWREGRAFSLLNGSSGPLDALVRFFPGEWLVGLPRRSAWRHFFCGAKTPVCNPATAMLTQSKRFPLVWDRLRVPLPTWRRLLPATCDPNQAEGPSPEEWVLKPAFGRVGEGVGVPGVTDEKELRKIRKAAKRHSGHWVAQRRFHALPVATAGGAVYPSLGIYTVGARAVGAYARGAAKPLINSHAPDMAVLVFGASGKPAAAASEETAK